MLEAVVGLSDAGRTERIRLENVSAGLEIGHVHRLHDIRTRQREQLVVALHVLLKVGEARAAVIGFGQPVPLVH